MGKEVKIGLAVILVLLITFGVVLARRLGGSGDETEIAEKSPSKSAKADAGEAKAESKAPAKGTAAKPTVVSAKGGSTIARAPNTLPKWNPPTGTSANVPGVGSAMMPAPPLSTSNRPLLPPTSKARQVATPGGVPSAGAAVAQGPLAALKRAGGTTTGNASAGQNSLRMLPSPSVGTASAGSSYAMRSRPPGHAGTTMPAPVPRGTYPSAATQQRPTPSMMASSRRPVGDPLDLSSPLQDVSPARTSNGEYEVQPNDNYWSISKRLYGTGAYFKALAEHNRDRVPQEDSLDYGDLIAAPEVAVLEREYPGLCPSPSRRETIKARASMVSTSRTYMGGRTYKVEEGDTLFDIARYELGKASRWAEILRLNRDIIGDDPNYLSPGMELVLPSDNARGGPDMVTERPGYPTTPGGGVLR